MAALVDAGRKPKTPLGAALYEYRTREGISQAELAKRIDVSVASVNNWETRDYLPTFTKAIEIADVLGVSMDQLAGRA